LSGGAETTVSCGATFSWNFPRIPVIPAHNLAPSPFDINGTIGERFDLPFWSSVGRIRDQTGLLSS